MNIPTRYEDLTVEQFQQLEFLKQDETLDKLDKAIKRLSILSGKSIEEVEALSATEVYNNLAKVIFLTSPITEIKCVDEINLNGTKFRYIKNIYDYNICQEKDWKEMIKANDNQYFKCLPELMAICHLEYINGNWTYNSDNHQKNVELFKKSKLSESLGAVFFYSKYLKTYTKAIQDCLAQQAQVLEEAKSMMLADPEFQTFLKDGGGNTQLV